jgi:hypothetical protein
MNGSDWRSAYWRDLRGSDLVHNGRMHVRHSRKACVKVEQIRRHMGKVRPEFRVAVIRLHTVSASAGSV